MSGPQAIAKSPRTGDGPLWMGGCIGGSLNGGASAANAADTKKRGEKHQRQMRRAISICSLRLSGSHLLASMRTCGIEDNLSGGVGNSASVLPRAGALSVRSQNDGTDHRKLAKAWGHRTIKAPSVALRM